jgi:hypothetical protein
MAGKLRQAVEDDGDRLADLHLWRLRPGHLGAIVSVVTAKPREADYYRSRFGRFTSLSHLTVAVGLHLTRVRQLVDFQLMGVEKFWSARRGSG